MTKAETAINPMPKPDHLGRHPVCGARTRRGFACQQPAMANGRCRLHGGRSTGPRTREGLDRSRFARWRHGRRSALAREAARAYRAFLRSTVSVAADRANEWDEDGSISAAHEAMMRWRMLDEKLKVTGRLAVERRTKGVF